MPIQVGVKVLLKNTDGTYLLLKRALHKTCDMTEEIFDQFLLKLFRERSDL